MSQLGAKLTVVKMLGKDGIYPTSSYLEKLRDLFSNDDQHIIQEKIASGEIAVDVLDVPQDNHITIVKVDGEDYFCLPTVDDLKHLCEFFNDLEDEVHPRILLLKTSRSVLSSRIKTKCE